MQFRREQKKDDVLRAIPWWGSPDFQDQRKIQVDAIMQKPVDLDRLLILLRRLMHEIHH